MKMTRSLVHFILLFILGCGTIRSSAAVALSLEDKLKEIESRLETKINFLESKNVQLEEMVTQLKTQLGQNNEKREELKSKVHHNFNNLINTHQSEVAINGLPSSCADLKMIGHIWSGFYSVMGNAMMESVYCDFTKLPSDAGFQKLIGYVDVKSAPVHFYVQRNSSFDIFGTPIPFDLALVNEGNAMNLTTGIFTAPRPGIYFFSFTGVVMFTSSSDLVQLGVTLFLNQVFGGRIAFGYVSEANTVNGQLSPLTLQTTLNLKKDDRVWLQIDRTSVSNPVLYDTYSDHFTHFTGFMLEEEIVANVASL